MALTNGHSNGDTDDVPSVRETIHSYIKDLKSQLDRLPEDAGVVKQIVAGLFTENILDDRE
jgi:hypothetical protein